MKNISKFQVTISKYVVLFTFPIHKVFFFEKMAAND